MLAAALCGGASGAWGVVEPLDFADDALRDRYLRLVRELRCPKCQNQNLYTSDALLAADLRRELRRMLEVGDSDDAIVRFMTARYGEFVRYRPGLSTATVFVWLAPGLLLLFGAVLAWRHLRARSRAAPDRGSAAAAVPDALSALPADAERAMPGWARYAAWAWAPTACALAAGLYWNTGAWRDWRLAETLRVDDWQAAAPMLERKSRARPEDLQSLSLLGSAYAHLRRPQDAARVWSQALSLAPPRSPAAAQLRMGIAAMSPALPGSGNGAEASAVAIQVDLRMAEGIAVPADLPIYVFARAVGESAPPMPLAVAKLSSGNLPASVVLDDSLAMLPSLRLSSAEHVRVTARISQDGDVAPGPGDWEGRSELLTLTGARQRIELVIDTELR